MFWLPKGAYRITSWSDKGCRSDGLDRAVTGSRASWFRQVLQARVCGRMTLACIQSEQLNPYCAKHMCCAAFTALHSRQALSISIPRHLSPSHLAGHTCHQV
jgi:hypothetical protein